MPDDEYDFTFENDDEWTLVLYDQGISIPSAHAATHAAAGSDPITISYSQVSGLGSMATQASSGVTITGGSISGITDLAVADGGTGASTLTGLLQGNGTGAFTTITNSTTIGQVLRVTGSNTYAWGALNLASANAITGTLPVGNGGTGASTLTGLIQGNGTSAFTVITNSTTVGQVLRVTGSNTYAWGALNLESSDAVTGTLPVGNGGTGVASIASLFTALGFASGTGTLVAGELVVADTDITSDSRVIPVHSAAVAPAGFLYVELDPGVGFTIRSSSGADANDVYYLIKY